MDLKIWLSLSKNKVSIVVLVNTDLVEVIVLSQQTLNTRLSDSFHDNRNLLNSLSFFYL